MLQMSVEEKPEKNETRNMQQSGNVTGVVTPTTSSHIIYRRSKSASFEDVSAEIA